MWIPEKKSTAVERARLLAAWPTTFADLLVLSEMQVRRRTSFAQRRQSFSQLRVRSPTCCALYQKTSKTARRPAAARKSDERIGYRAERVTQESIKAWVVVRPRLFERQLEPFTVVSKRYVLSVHFFLCRPGPTAHSDNVNLATAHEPK
jgi:hypothetical protein